MNENDFAAGGEDDIGASGQCPDMQAVAVTEPVENSADGHFRLRVRGADGSHDERTLRGENVICHTLRFPKQRPLVCNVFIGGIANDPSERNFLLLGDLFERFISVRRKSDGGAGCCSFRFHILCPC